MQLLQLGIDCGLNVVLNLNVSGISLVAGHAEGEIVLASGERKSRGGPAGFLRAIDKDVRSGGMAANCQQFVELISA
jgi:hypothetical protein